MSMFLAPIHTWLFEKIILAQDLEKNIVNEHINIFNEEAKEIQEKAVELYGSYIEDKPLEGLIDTNNIHGWLQNKISEVESRTAYILTKYKEVYKGDSEKISIKEYSKQGKECALKEGNKINTPENVYMTINNYLLSGMPCDRANSIIEKNDEYIIYSQAKCIHKENYERGNGNLEYLYKLREEWMNSFINSLNPNYDYEVKLEGSSKTYKITKR